MTLTHIIRTRGLVKLFRTGGGVKKASRLLLHGFVTIFLIIPAVLVMTPGDLSAKPSAAIKKVRIEKNPYGIRIKLTGKVPYKVVQFDKKELLVAFKGVKLSEPMKPLGNGRPFIKDITISKRKHGVVSMIISTQSEIQSVSSIWIPVGNTLLVKPVQVGAKVKVSEKKASGKEAPDTGSKEPDRLAEGGKPPQLSTGAIIKTEEDAEEEDIFDSPPPPPVAAESDIGYSLGGRKFDERFSGTTDDLFLELRSDACEEIGEMKKVVILCNQKAWGRAYEIVSRYADDESLGIRCLENILILRAYSYYKDIEEGSPQDYLEAADYFQELMSYFPDSIYTPYALTALGKIHVALKDLAQAEGYFQVVLKEFQSYPGTPEVMFELGRIFSEKKRSKIAITMLRKVVNQFPKGSFIGKAKLELGKALFNVNDFNGAVKVLEDVEQNHPRMVFDSPDLLRFLGNAYYHSGNSEKARIILGKVYNLFPEVEGRDTILTRIGDTYVENKKKDKAIKIFQLVIEKYPGTDGFVISSMRLADFLEEREKKEELYNMIIKDFPDNPLARLALMRLALLQHKSGDYDKSIETIKTLLETQPRALKKDAVSLLQDSSELIFKKLLADDDYTQLLTRFEADKKILDKAESPNLFLLVGMAYLKAHLYENAVDMLLKSYKRTGKSKRTPDLVFSLGVAMDEAGREDEALNMLGAYVKYFPEKNHAAQAYGRIGEIYLQKKKYEKALVNLTTAYKISATNKERAGILVNKSRGHKALKEHKTAVSTLINAINLLAGEPDESFDTLSLAHRNLGENYMQLGEWAKAADAFGMAVKFAGEGPGVVEIYFMLGEAHEKSKRYTDAEKAYQTVIEKGDSFWSSMAKERLRGMALVRKLEKT